MTDIGSLLVFLAMLALLSLLDARARVQQRQREQREAQPRSGTGELPRPSHAPSPFPEPPLAEEEKQWAGEPAEEVPPLVVEAEPLWEEGRRELAAPAPTEPVEEEEVERVDPAVVPLRPRAPRRARATPLASGLVGELGRGSEALRKAVLYREVLGAPLGLRGRSGGWEDPD